MEIKKELTLEEKYSTLCQQLGDVEVCIATYESIKAGMLREAGRLQNEMQDKAKSDIKIVKDMGLIP